LKGETVAANAEKGARKHDDSGATLRNARVTNDETASRERVTAVAADRPSDVAHAFFNGGAVHVRGVAAAAATIAIRSAAERVFREWERLAQNGALPPDLDMPHQRQYIPLELLETPQPVVETVMHPSLLAVARTYLGKEPEIHANSHVRAIRVSRSDAHLPFHQDQTILGRRLVNIWIPLDACGVDAPGLEVVYGSWSALLEPSPPAQPLFAVERARLDFDAVAATFGTSAFWHPVFEPGDAMLFAGATVHRTHVTPAMGTDRLSIEIRLL
jgi:ectoine hydroxylase-related dioxygenase (phytanoyl-CoA dioxygenase family)